MQLKKLNILNIKRSLTREEMKKIMAGIADCQNYGEHCDTEQQLNCCSGLSCIDNKCDVPPAPEKSKKN